MRKKHKKKKKKKGLHFWTFISRAECASFAIIRNFRSRIKMRRRIWKIRPLVAEGGIFLEKGFWWGRGWIRRGYTNDERPAANSYAEIKMAERMMWIQLEECVENLGLRDDGEAFGGWHFGRPKWVVRLFIICRSIASIWTDIRVFLLDESSFREKDTRVCWASSWKIRRTYITRTDFEISWLEKLCPTAENVEEWRKRINYKRWQRRWDSYRTGKVFIEEQRVSSLESKNYKLYTIFGTKL